MTKRILLIGERALDRFIVGKCPRISPEACVPVFLPQREDMNPGMAANVLANLNSLAPDWHVDFFHQANPINKIRLVDEHSGQQIVRVDLGDENVEPINLDNLFAHVADKTYDAIVISQYKTFIVPEHIAAVAAWAKGKQIPVFVDTKHLIAEDWARDVTVIKINRKEADAHGEEPWPYSEYVIVTEGPKGAYLHARAEPGNLLRVPGKPADVRCVSGAGDSFLAGLVVSYLEQSQEDKTERLIKAIAFANKVARVAVSKPGVVAVKREEVV